MYDAALKSFQSGRLDVAERRCRKTLAADPAHADALHLLGVIYGTTNRLDLGIDSIAQAVRSNPTNPDYFFNLGGLLQRQNRFDEAFKSFNIAVQLKPDYGRAWIRLGDLLTQAQQLDDALLSYDRALALDAGNAEAANKSGRTLMTLHRYDEALARFDLLAKISPDNAEALCEMGVCLFQLKRPEQAVAHFRAAIEAKPDFMNALHNLGSALIELKRFGEALPVLDRAIALGATFAETYCNRGICLDWMMRREEALGSYRNALVKKPDYADAHWNLALNRLLAGDFKTGWVEAEWRWKSSAGPKQRQRTFAQPLWLGREPIEGKTLLLHTGEGLGDALQFCRYAPHAAARGARVVLEIEPPLRGLLATLEGVSDIVVQGEALPPFDYHCALSSLPLAFDTTLETIPSTIPYLSIPDDTRDWRAWLGPAKGPRIGLVWSGNPDHSNDRNRSIGLEKLLPLLDLKAQFVSLQKDPRPHDSAILRERSDIRDAGPELKSFSDSAALLSHIDLLITVDTSMAHLAGALGRPTWLLLPYLPDWRWLLDRDDSPWYPSLRLFRQADEATWPPVVQRVKEALQEMAT